MNKKWQHRILFLIPSVVLMWIMVPHLGVPYFYDEAWSYFPAIKKMADHIPTLLPGGYLSISDCKGHPQLFYFLSAIWMKTVGGTIWLTRLFPLLLSLTLLIVVFRGMEKISGRDAAFYASWLIAVQSMFLAQSILLLPEIMMTLFLVIALFAFQRGKFIWYGFAASLMVLTKETSILFALLFGLIFLVRLIKPENRNGIRLKTLLWIMLPGFVYAAFLFSHYLRLGTLFYDAHLNYITNDFQELLDKLSRASSFIFIRHGRLSTLILFILVVIGLIWQKKLKGSFYLIPLLLLTGFLIFSVFNFYTQRYGLVAMVLFSLVIAGITARLKLSRWIKNVGILIVGLVCLGYSLTEKHNTDVDLGYIETTRAFTYVVHRCEAGGLYDKPIAASFNLIFALTNPSLGYRTNDRPFTQVGDRHTYLNKEFFVYESTSSTNEPSFRHVVNAYTRVDSIQIKHAWGVIYQNRNHTP
jgi:hypothetical protein